MTIDQRIEIVREFAGLSDYDVEMMQASFTKYFPKSDADDYIENCVAAGNPPMGIATNARINGVDYLIPMMVEEPSIVAAASRAFKTARQGEIYATSLSNSMIGQVYVKRVSDPKEAAFRLADKAGKLLDIANKGHEHTRAHGYAVETFENELDFRIIVDTGDVQGANVVNLMCEAIAPRVAEITGGEVVTAILSNYAEHCIAEATMTIPKSVLARPDKGCPDAEKVCERFLDLALLAKIQPYRAATNNKGIMNGIVALANATGQDTRSLEAGAHAYASRTGAYRSMSNWHVDGENLVGNMQLPAAVGTVRGATGFPYAQLGLKILGNPSAPELQEIMVAVGLANNYAALHTLVTDGINRGHLALHEKRF